MSNEAPRQAWSVVGDSSTGEITLRFGSYISSGVAIVATWELVNQLALRRSPTVVVFDFSEVTAFDAEAPPMIVQLLAPRVMQVERIDIIVERPIVRIAAVSALHLLGVPHTIRSRHDSGGVAQHFLELASTPPAGTSSVAPGTPAVTEETSAIAPGRAALADCGED